MIPAIAVRPLEVRSPTAPLLVVGPSLGTAVADLWGPCARLLADRFDVVGWDLPGHGYSAPATAPFTIEELADGVLAALRPILAQRGEPGGAFRYAGVSVGGAVGLALLLSHAGRLTAATLTNTAARIGTSAGWAERAATVRAGGTVTVVDASSRRWFAEGFLDRRPGDGGRLLDGLLRVEAGGYAQVCDALAGFDVRDRLGTIDRPVALVAGRADEVTPVEGLEQIAQAVRGARLVVLDGAAHLAPVERPRAVADVIEAGGPPADPTRRTRGDQGRPAGCRS